MAASDPVHHGDADQTKVTWGVGDDYSSYGILLSLQSASDADFSELKNEIGNVVGMTIYNKRQSVTAEIIKKPSADAPAVGSVVTISGTKYLCRSCNVTARNEDRERLSMTLEKYDSLSLT